LQIETADVNLIGYREENQDRVAIVVDERAVLMAVVDGMGGHAEGARAAETALATLVGAFWQTPRPIFDPLGFLHLSLGRAHEEVVKLGSALSVESRPRATCAMCLVQDAAAYWAHVGDSRIYQLRQQQVLERTRDHSHVELLLREGLINESEVSAHPLRNYVECCLGGDAALPEMSITSRRRAERPAICWCCARMACGAISPIRISCVSRRGASRRCAMNLFELATQAVQMGAPPQRQHDGRGAAPGSPHERATRVAGAPDELRALGFDRSFTRHAEGSVLVSFGDTRVLCTASVESGVPSIPARHRARLGDRGIRHAAARHPYPFGARGVPR